MPEICNHEIITTQREISQNRKAVRAGCSKCDIWGRWYSYHGYRPYDICKVVSTAVHDFLWSEVKRQNLEDETSELEEQIVKGI